MKQYYTTREYELLKGKLTLKNKVSIIILFYLTVRTKLVSYYMCNTKSFELFP